MDATILEEVGLSKGEAEIYLVLLKIGESTASEIAKHTRIARPNVYDYLNKLMEKSLVSFVTKSHKKHYIPAPPTKILSFLEEKKDIVADKMDLLMAMYTARKDAPLVQIYEGESGFKTLMNDVIQAGKSFVGWGGSDRVREYLPDHYVERYLTLREKHNIGGKLLFAKTDTILKTPLTEFKEIPEEFTSPSTTLVYDDKVAIMIYTAIPVVIIIQSKELAKSYNKHFELLWSKIEK